MKTVDITEKYIIIYENDSHFQIKGTYTMKKLKLILIMLLSVFSMLSCSNTAIHDDGKIDIVCTSFPQYDWANNIVKGSENVNVVLLNRKGTDMHSYQPSADDIIKVDTSDVLILIGGESDNWAEKAVSDKSKTSVINLLELTGQTVEHEHDEHSHSHDAQDEHIWMSVKNAVLFTEKITEVLCSVDTDNSELYKTNSEEYIKQLEELDGAFTKACENAEKKVMVVADRFPFSYLANDYNIKCYAAFPGCSSDTDASPDTIITLASVVDKHGLEYVAVTENNTGKTVKAVISNTINKNQQTVIIDSMQTVSEKDIENGVTYIGIMEKNLEAVKKLLG